MNYLSKVYWAYRNKATNKLWGVARMPAQGKKKGFVLLSYINSPLTLAPWEAKADPHYSYWESKEMARLFSARGYAVDCINAAEHRFIPKKPYVACVDIQQDLERLSAFLPKSCKKVIHIDNPNYRVYNEREAKRLGDLYRRRGVRLEPRRQIQASQSVARADFLEGLGNESVHATFAELRKPIFPIPLGAAETFPFPDDKDFAKAKKSFLYFGGGGAVLKGLDLALEAFSGMPDLTLHIVGPGAYEKDFAREYAKELALPNIVLHSRPKIGASGRISVDGRPFPELADSCLAIVYPSAAEGTSGAVIQAVHMGLIPVVTPETGIDPRVGGVTLQEPTVESIRAAVRKLSQAGEGELRDMARRAWSFAHGHYTKEAASKAHAAFIDTMLKL